ncbi:MAG: HNH endonuclease [Gammaproteobacteria bacterium]|nr:HNH endonuclease [Gammaproteobacteria bacterium]
MRLNVDFRALEDAVRRMGAASIPVDLDLDVRLGIDPLDPIDIELRHGIEIDDLFEIRPDPDSGVLTYQGRQIVLYIQDHSTSVENALAHGEGGRKVHVADCATLREMKRLGRYERYVATNDTSGDFYVTGQDEYGGRVEGRARLRVCKNCLRMLNYRNYVRNRTRVFRDFEWTEFFDRYRPHFQHLPTRRAGVFDGGYTPDWDRVSAGYKRSCDFKCEQCHVDLSQRRHHRLLHVHHVDGVKTNNDRSNLRALCAICHGDQPGHGHMYVSTEDTALINSIRRQQNRPR